MGQLLYESVNEDKEKGKKRRKKERFDCLSAFFSVWLQRSCRMAKVGNVINKEKKLNV
jgi:hypothetical protein